MLYELHLSYSIIVVIIGPPSFSYNLSAFIIFTIFLVNFSIAAYTYITIITC
ncbi:hypothetical protein HanHA89_Chr12g0458301 [Helianthus annuus]|nr:hypothetical protein HanHA89_Chr12g0458301 [Helianthus annuus]